MSLITKLLKPVGKVAGKIFASTAKPAAKPAVKKGIKVVQIGKAAAKETPKKEGFFDALIRLHEEGYNSSAYQRYREIMNKDVPYNHSQYRW